MNQIEQFFTLGFKDQVAIMGTECILTNRGKITEFKGVIVHGSGETEVELSGALYTVNATALIPDTFSVNDLISSILESAGSKYFISAAVKDPFQPFWSCSLTRID